MGGFMSSARNYGATLEQAWPPKPRFSPEQMPDLTGRVVIVTGLFINNFEDRGNTGVGKETVKALLQHNAKTYLAARSQEKAEAAIAELKAATGKEAIWLELDLASLASVRRAAEAFLSKERELHILFNNAGVAVCPVEMLTADRYDMQFGTNVLGPFFFTELLMPALVEGAKSSPDGHARVVTTSSSAAYLGVLHYETMRDNLEARKKLGSPGLYYQSKFGDAVLAREIARRYADKGILSFSCNPGWWLDYLPKPYTCLTLTGYCLGNLSTDLQRHMTGLQRKMILAMTYPAHYGALTQLWTATMPEVIDHNGEFLIPWARFGRCRDEVYDPEVGDKLWSYLQEQVKGH
ncbi:hypothetical protein EIP86_000069 [Pleurotus ostreatoroseus]|nr:hypothetical protein EIP86_000069 [Pleurotus ostreatoroseus]